MNKYIRRIISQEREKRLHRIIHNSYLRSPKSFSTGKSAKFVAANAVTAILKTQKMSTKNSMKDSDQSQVCATAFAVTPRNHTFSQ